MGRIASKTKTVRYGYVGTWNDGTLGWGMPQFISGWGPRLPDRPTLEQAPWLKDHKLFKCKITIELVKDKRGRPIQRGAKA